jgi:catechol 2,3-dioxygenase-like lactoylglutathione lyase family enzyme
VTAEDPMMVGAATVFVVTDIAKSRERYREVLGFPRLTGRGPAVMAMVIRLEGSQADMRHHSSDVCCRG